MSVTTSPPPALKAPFPWFGGKRQIAHLVWARFGDVANYVEPFCGSLAVLLGRPTPPRIETVNDADCYLANFWRALQAEPDTVAGWADWPVNEADLHARHQWLVNQAEFRERMKTDPDYYDVKIAGWWVWGISCWIGGGWCQVRDKPVKRQKPHLHPYGNGVHRNSLSDYSSVEWRRPHLTHQGLGVHRKSLSDTGLLLDYCQALAVRLRGVRVVCGDWQRVLTPTVTSHQGLTAVFLDPPYDLSLRNRGCYSIDEEGISQKVQQWAVFHGDNPRMRIALCGYEGEHAMPDSWDKVAWKAGGGLNRGKGRNQENSHLERIWFSPHCLKPDSAGEGFLPWTS